MILGIIQARTSSTRLPGKVLLPLAGAPMLARQLERIGRASRIDRLMLATSVEPADDAVAAIGSDLGVALYRGSRDDVLDRFYQAAQPHAPTHVVRLTADCPLCDWDVIDRAIDFVVGGAFDYGSNSLRPTWPDGLDVEVLTFETLQCAWREANSPVDREHVTRFVVENPDRFSIGSLENDIDLSGLRWTVDEPRDYEFVCRVYEALYVDNPTFGTADVLDLLHRRPELLSINSGIDRNEGLRRSIERYSRDSE